MRLPYLRPVLVMSTNSFWSNSSYHSLKMLNQKSELCRKNKSLWTHPLNSLNRFSSQKNASQNQSLMQMVAVNHPLMKRNFLRLMLSESRSSLNLANPTQKLKPFQSRSQKMQASSMLSSIKLLMSMALKSMSLLKSLERI